MNERLLTHYNNLWESARSQFVNGKCKVDPLIDDHHDQRRGITLLARPDQTIIDKISDLQNNLKHIEPEQYFQPISDLHLTVLSIISCYAGFDLSQIKTESYKKIVSECLTKSITIRCQGITASPSGVLIQGFPEGNELETLREGLRDSFKSADLPHSIDSRYRISTAHLTIMRFRKPMVNPKKFVGLLEKFQHHFFGKMKIGELHLVFNDWYQRTEIVKDLATFELY
ncbi:2'-5' RNA ligase [Reichenbachiella faecimaris]|uniref:2'-5' RNA ligase n=1 Tax=Reichenbachiella faecimaris TaxID=692418 RepID=A0A1W2GH49_REIFA|nr:hypothetical protein [Reichenbachiella faecimaris]SMD35901.1 2'-5' RNA ligase [Reichenbachiella faecimaris]